MQPPRLPMPPVPQPCSPPPIPLGHPRQAPPSPRTTTCWHGSPPSTTPRTCSGEHPVSPRMPTAGWSHAPISRLLPRLNAEVDNWCPSPHEYGPTVVYSGQTCAAATGFREPGEPTPAQRGVRGMTRWHGHRRPPWLTHCTVCEPGRFLVVAPATRCEPGPGCCIAVRVEPQV